MTANGLNGRRTAVQKAALVFGVLFLLIGVLGFIPGVTSNYDNMTFVGHGDPHSPKLLGIFEVNVLHNLLHLLLGAALVWASKAREKARQWLIISGVVYLLLFLYGILVDHDSDANFGAFNDADNWLHVLLALGLLLSGFLLSKRRDEVGQTDEYL